MTKYLGADYIIEKQFTDADGNPIPFADISSVVIGFVHRKTGDSVIVWKYPTETGYKPITVVDAVNGDIKFYIDDSETVSEKTGFYDLQYKLAVTNANFADGKYEDIEIEEYDLFEDSIIKSE